MGSGQGYREPEEARCRLWPRPGSIPGPQRVIARDLAHSQSEERFYCFGSVGGGILTVRFTYRNNVIRIIGAGYWRKGKRIYEQENQILE